MCAISAEKGGLVKDACNWNVGDKASRVLMSTSPSGFEKFFSRCADEFAKPGGPDMQRIVSISAEHGIHFVQP